MVRTRVASAGLGVVCMLNSGCLVQSSERSDLQETRSTTTVSAGQWGTSTSGGASAASGGQQQQTFQAKDVTYIITAQPIRLRQDLNPLLEKLRSRRGLENNLVCAQTMEINGLFLCGGTTRLAQHIPLMRAAIYAEGRPSMNINSAGQFVSQQVASSGYSRSYGHDLPQSLLQSFFTGAKGMCPDFSCLLEGEVVFASKVMPEFQRRSPGGYSVVSFDVESEDSVSAALKHEISHGQFFQQSGYRMAVQMFWLSLPMDIQMAAQKMIGMNYDVSNQELLMNEFHAYILDGKFSGLTADSIASAKKYDIEFGQAMEVLAMNAQQLNTNLRNSIQNAGQQIWAGSL
ncbi:MAG: hypothetical protein ACO3A4_11785 [Silvanigrellaceae bacterium]